MAAGDIKYEQVPFWLLPVSKNATADISKGDVVSLPDGRKCAAGDGGPFGVAIADITSGEDMRGKVLVKGAVDVVAAGAISQFNFVKPAANGQVDVAAKIAVAVPSGATPVTSDAAQPDLTESGSIPPDGLVGRTLDAASTAGDLITVLLD